MNTKATSVDFVSTSPDGTAGCGMVCMDWYP